MRIRVAGIFLVSILVLALCPFPAFSQQSAQQSRPPVTQFGVLQRRVNPAPIPPEAHRPDKLLEGATISTTITALAFSPDGKWLAWSGYDNTIMIWNAATGAEERRLTWPRPPSTPLTELVFSPDRKHLAAFAAGQLRLWDSQTGRTIYSRSIRSSSPRLTYSPDGKFFATIVAGAQENSMARIEIRDATTGNIQRTIATQWYRVAGMTITRDGLLTASGTTNEDIGDEEDPRGTVQVWRLGSGDLVKTSPVFDVVGQVSPDGRFMATVATSEQGKAGIVITDLSNGDVKWTLRQSSPALLFFGPDSRKLAVTSGGSERALTVWSLATGTVISHVHGERDPNDPSGLTTLAFSPDGQRIAAAPYPVFSAKIWDVSAGRELREFAGQFSVQALAMRPDGKWLVSAAPGVTVQDPATGKIITTLTLEDADMLLFSPDGRWLAANPGVFPGGMGRSLEVWDTRTWTLAANLTPQRDPRRNLPVQWIAFGNSSPPGKLGDARSHQFTADGQTHTVWFSDSPMAISPDGKLLAELGYPANNVNIWDTSSGQTVQIFSAHKVGVQYLAFSADGRSLLTIGQDSLRTVLADRTIQGINEFSVKVWEVATWKESLAVSVPHIRPSSALLSPDGHRLAVERSREVVALVDADNGSSLGAFAATAPGSNAGWSVGKPNLAFSPDGTFLFQGAKNGIRVWKLPHP
jgi:WD40 repeat protein